MPEETDSNPEDFTPIGSFTISEYEKVSDIFESKGIIFEQEWDKEEVSEVMSRIAVYGALSKPTGNVILMYVKNEDAERASKILLELYPA